MQENSYLAPFNENQQLRLRRMPNGGWVVSGASADVGRMDDDLGAFSSAEEMLAALSEALVSKP